MFLYLAMIDSDADKSKFEILYSEYKNLMYYTASRRYRVPAAALPLGPATAVRLRLFQRGDCEYSGYNRAERAQAHPACQGKTQRSAERDGGTVNENH